MPRIDIFRLYSPLISFASFQKVRAYLLPAIIVNSTFLSLNTVVAKPNKNVLKHKKILMALVVIAILIAGYWIYGQASTYTNKRDFQQADKSISDANRSISGNLGKPDKSERDNKCSRSYQELTGYGDTTCFVDLSLIYIIDNENQANTIMNKVQNILKNISIFSSPQKSLATSLKDAVALGNEYHESQDLYKFKNLTCTSKYVYDTPQDTFMKLNTNKKIFYIVIGCTGPAKKLYYPLNQ